jgi:hypothetical protein
MQGGTSPHPAGRHDGKSETGTRNHEQMSLSRLSVTFLSWVTRHIAIAAWACILAGDRTDDLASGGHGTSSSHGDHCRGSF